MLAVLEPILNYYSTGGYIIKIKNSKDQEITLEELVEQYFGKAEDYFEVKKIIEKTEESEQVEKKETEIQNEEPLTQQEREEKYKKEQEEIKKWG